MFRSRRLLASKRCSQPPARHRATSRPIDALKAFDTEPGFAVTLVAAEPLVVDPVALAFDDRGRLFVAENRDYPTGSQDGRPLGVIALLEDTDDDGRMDKRTEFASGIAFPNGVMCWRGGVIVAAAPDAHWLKDADGDGRAEVREVLLTGFASGGPSQLRVNDPTLGPDGWIYFAGGLREESVCGRALFFLLLLCATVTPMRPLKDVIIALRHELEEALQANQDPPLPLRRPQNRVRPTDSTRGKLFRPEIPRTSRTKEAPRRVPNPLRKFSSLGDREFAQDDLRIAAPASQAPSIIPCKHSRFLRVRSEPRNPLFPVFAFAKNLNPRNKLFESYL